MLDTQLGYMIICIIKSYPLYHIYNIFVFLLPQPEFESLSQHSAAKKVTFDITESDLSSTMDAQDQTGTTI